MVHSQKGVLTPTRNIFWLLEFREISSSQKFLASALK